MANFTNIQITNQGRALQAKAQAGAALNFTRFRIGSGSMSGQQIADMAGLIQPVMWLTLNKSQAHSAGRHTLGAPFTNSGISTGFYFREWGVFAQDPDVGEIMYCYGNVGSGAEYIPAGGGSEIIEQQLDMITLIGNAANVSAVIDESLMFATISQLNAHKQTTVLDHPDGSVTAAKLANNAATDAKIGNRTITDTAEPTGNTGTLTNLLSWLGNMIKTITGKASWRTAPAINLETAKTEIDALKAATAEGQTIPAPISRGVNVIQSDQASGATFNVRGCTLCNILGRDGGCESLAPFSSFGDGATLSTVQKRSGLQSIQMSVIGSSFSMNKDYSYVLDKTKTYILLAWVYIESFTTGAFTFSLRDVGTTMARYTGPVNTSLVGQWQLVYIKVPTSNTLVGDGFRLQFGPSTLGSNVSYWDEIRLYEVSAADYAAIGTTITGEAIDRRWPYVDSVQHTRGLSVLMPGKNIFEPENPVANGAGASYVQKSAGVFEVTSGAGQWHYVYFKRVKVAPNTTYTISAFLENLSGADTPMFSVRRGSNASAISEPSGVGIVSTTINTSTETELILHLYASRATAAVQTKRFSDIQIELGSTRSSFEPYNPSYANADTILASNVDRSIADSYDSATGQVFRRWIIRSIDGGLAWTYGQGGVGQSYKQIHVIGFDQGTPSDRLVYGAKYNGEVIRGAVLGDSGGNAWINPAGDFRIRVFNTESGWVESINPNDFAVKALMNGWKANGNNGSAYNSWVSILDGSAPATNTQTWVSQNKVTPGFSYATLTYVRATPITEQLTGDLGGLAMVKGGNTVELLEGVVVRERAYPKLDGSGWYIISADSSEFWGTSRVKYATRKFLAVYKGADIDNNWTDISGPPTYISTRATTYTAAEIAANEWYVDYIVMDKHTYTANAVDATLVYRSTLGGAVAQATQDIAKLQQHNGVQDFALDYIQAHVENVQKSLSEYVGVVDYVRSPGYTGTSGRTATDFLVDLNPAPTALVDGMAFSFKAKYSSLDGIGINLNGLGSKLLRTIDDKPIKADQIPGGSIVSVRYNQNTNTFILQGVGGATSEGSSVAEYLITTTSQTTILSYTPKASGKLKRVMVYFRVITGPTNVAITLTHTDVTGAQTLILVASQSYAVGSYAIPVTAVYSSGVMNMNVTANAANRVYVTAEIEE